MIRIKHVTLPEKDVILVDYEGTIGDYIADNFHPGDAFSIFSGQPCLDNDITLRVLEGEEFEGEEYTVADTPSAGITVAGWIAIISLVISVAAMVLAPKPKIPGNVRREQESPNNALGSRSNQARPLQRVPDIKGTVKSVPDIIMPTYYRYRDLRTKAEYGYYCIGRKSLAISDIKDGDTPISLVEGASAQVYGPYKSPNNSTPDIQIGEPINQRIVIPYRSNEVDGVDLPGPQEIGSNPLIATQSNSDLAYDGIFFGIRNETDGRLRIAGTFFENGFEISPDYYVGNNIILEDFIVEVGTESYDLSGEYEILEIVEQRFTSSVNYLIYVDSSVVWSGTEYAAIGANMRTKFSTPYNEWVYMTRDTFDRGHVNIVAQNGLYRDKGTTNVKTITIDIEVEVEPVNSAGLPSGASEIISAQMSGNSQTKRGLTVDFNLPYRSSFRCRVRRLTGDILGTGTIMDDIKWEDLYGIKDVDELHFGDVTTIQTVTVSTPFATALKERQVNCIATEKLYEYLGGGVFDTELTENSSAIQSYITDFIDPVMGNRPIAELDADGLLTMESEIANYFGSTAHGEFSYTLDSTDITFQEYTQMLFNAINSVAYRDGSIVKAHFERPVTIPARLFTHRSKIPNSETYSRNFNYSQLPDGVEFKWINPETNTQEVIYIPDDRSAASPKKFEMAGFRNWEQAYKRAWREYNKIANEKIIVDLEVTADGRDIKPGDVISIVKGSRTNTADGEVLSVSLDGYTLTLSQDVEFTAGDTHYIILKKSDGSIQSILCTAGTESNQVVLASLPDEAIRTGIDYQRRTEFSFGNEAKHEAQMYIARSIDVSNQHTVQLKCVNYTDAYYANDSESFNAFDSGFDEGFS